MGLLDTLNELEGTPDEVTINDGEIKDVEKAEEPEKEEVAEEEDHSEEPEKEEEEAPTESLQGGHAAVDQGSHDRKHQRQHEEREK